jgi:hypothetical protein
MNSYIKYGIGESYLKDWDIKHALREIFQNFIDYGNYEIYIKETRNNKVLVLIENTYQPQSLEFLQIGKSIKSSSSSIGKHGEGLKMAFLIFLRENLYLRVFYNNINITPEWNNQAIGKTLALKMSKSKYNYPTFNIEFTCDKETFYSFKNNIIEDKDILYKDSYHGSIVDKPKGNLYSGKLFVTNLPNLKKAYDISPNLLSLDRDRRIPSSFEVSYHTSKINESQLRKEEETKARLNFVDESYDDYSHVNYVPSSQLKDIKVKEVLGKVEFTTKVINNETKEEEEIIIKNENIKSYLKSQNIFNTAINKIKNYIASKLGIKDLLLNFRKKYCYSVEAKQDFDIILERLGITLDID